MERPMSFGYRDRDWINPPEPPIYHGTCARCAKFDACPCGCGWGHCEDDPGEWIEEDGGCEEGYLR